MSNLLVELFVEELPPKALKSLGDVFSNQIFINLERFGLVLRAEVVNVKSFATPRRLAVFIPNVLSKGADRQDSQKLMPVAVGLDANGIATPALLKKLAAFGADENAVAKLKRESDGKTEQLFLDLTIQGAPLKEGLQLALNETLAKLPIPKVMTYQLEDGWTSVNFVRPAHGLVAMHGSSTLDISVLGLKSGNTTQGHRFEAKNAVITLSHADNYEAQLLSEGAVIASFATRKAEISKQLNAAAAKENLTPIDDDALLDEVTALVERPNVLLGQFEQEYLEVPQECLILTMKANQKYFPLLNANGKLTNKFLIVSNINPIDPSAVIQGNERVVRPRLADAKFFFDQDRKKSLESRVAGLDKVVYHNKLGSQGERNARVVKIAGEIAKQIGDANLVAKVELAARLSKTDLVTDMVGEFPELQGIMGRYYAQHEGLDDDVAFAIEDHYKPRFSGDSLPRSKAGLCVALADKLETLAGMFFIGEKPTGDKDPFGLRRHALGIIRMLAENDNPLMLDKLFTVSIGAFNNQNQSIAIDLMDFFYDRLATYLREPFRVIARDNSTSVVPGFSPQIIESVLSLKPTHMYSLWKKLAAVREFDYLPEAEPLAAANKRVGNILKKVEGEVTAEVSANLLQEPAEIALNKALSSVKPKADAAFEAGDYTASLQELAALKAPVDDFFDNVMVNADDPALKANRLALLNQLHQAMNRVADLSKLAS